ncbi:hypothetical protein JTB14_029436 [Gonioctena quinquepunctata]|nr:hypothetical protein JTB14_029436 [Gonioctena quinquepunctata]
MDRRDHNGVLSGESDGGGVMISVQEHLVSSPLPDWSTDGIMGVSDTIRWCTTPSVKEDVHHIALEIVMNILISRSLPPNSYT